MILTACGTFERGHLAPADAAPDVVAVDAARDAAIDAPAVIGDGSLGAPYTASPAPVSCAVFLTDYPQQAGHDGSYSLAGFVGYCDMTTDGGGWTLGARVLATSTTHETALAVGTVTDPAQATTAKHSDAAIRALAFQHVRIAIEGTGTVYASVTTLDLSGTEFSDLNAAGIAYAGPYNGEFLTQVSCSSDCGVAVMRPGMGFGNNCGYRYYSNANNPTAGMGCQGNHGLAGTLWVQ